MFNVIKKSGGYVVRAFLLLITIASIVSATELGPRRRPGQRNRNTPISVAEPAAIALLGAGLVSLGFYAKKKRGKKQ